MALKVEKKGKYNAASSLVPLRSHIETNKEKAKTFDQLVEEFRKTTSLDKRQLLIRARIDSKLYSKLRLSAYPSTRDVLFSVGLALQLSIEKFSELLKSKGFAFCLNRDFDLIIIFCVENKIYDIMDVNELLQKMGQKRLRSRKPRKKE